MKFAGIPPFRIEYNDAGGIEEVVVQDCGVHIERLINGQWHVLIIKGDDELDMVFATITWC